MHHFLVTIFATSRISREIGIGLVITRVSPRATCLKTFEAPKKREYLDRSAMEVEQHRPGNNINSKEDTTSSPLSRDVQDHKDGAICSYVTSVLGRHTHTETSSLISSLSDAHTITSEPFTKGFRVESKCSTSNGSLASDDTSYEMQQVRNPIHFLEPGHNSEDIKSENNTSASCTSQSSVAEEDGSPLTLDTPGSVSENCKIIVASDSPNKCVVARIEDDEIRLITGPIILDQIAPENDSRKPGHNFENIKSQNNVSISSSSQSPVVEENGSALTLDAQGAAFDMNGNCKICAGPDSPSNSLVAPQSESERCQNELEIDEIIDPIILDDIAPENDSRGSPLTLDTSGAASNGTCKILADSDSPNNSVVTQLSKSERCQNEMKYENDSREPERCQTDMDVDTPVTNESYDLVNSNRAPDHKDCASYINNNLDEPSSSHQKISLTFQNDMEIEDNKVSENHQGSPLNGGSFYTSDKRLISRTHSPGVLESGGAH